MSAFSDALYLLPAMQLHKMMLNRQADLGRFNGVKSKVELADRIAAEFARPVSVQHAITLCNAHQLQFLQSCVTLQKGGHVAWKRVVEHCGGAEIEPVLVKVAEGLADLGLALHQGSEVYLQPNLETVVPTSLSERFTVEKCLQNLDAQSVQRMAGNLGVTVVKPTKVNHVKGICDFLHAPDLLQKLENILTPEDMGIVEYICNHGGSVPAEDLVEPPTSRGYYYRYEWHTNWQKGVEDTSVDRLLGRGVVYATWQGYGYDLQLVIPGDLLRTLAARSDNAFWLEVPSRPEPLPDSPNSVSVSPNLIRDVTALLGYLQSQECIRTGTGSIHRTALKNAARYLSHSDEDYTSFLYCLCRESDFLYVSGEKQVYGVNEKGRSWLHWDTKTQHRVLFEAWRNGMMWGEMYEEPIRKANAPRSLDFMVSLRGQALSLLAEAETTDFLFTPVLFALFMFRCPFILSDPRSNEEIVGSQIDYMRALVEQCLYWLGMAELGLQETPSSSAKPATEEEDDEENLPIGYRLTPLGRWLVKGERYELPEPPREEQFVLQANGEIFAPPYLSPIKYYEMLNFAEFPIKGAQMGHPVVTKESLRRAIDRGETVQSVMDYLSAASRVGVPQNIEYLIKEVGGKHGHIHLGRATLYIKVDSPILLQELQARKEFKGLFHRTLSDTIALLNGEDLDKTLKDLRKAGYLPVSDEETLPQAITEKFHPKAPPSLKEDPTARKLATYRQKLEKVVDWRQFAQKDAGYAPVAANVQQKLALPPQMPAGAQAGQQVVKFLVLQSINLKRPLEIAIESATPGVVETMLVQPSEVQGEVVVVYDLQKKTHHIMQFGSIHWARMVK